MKRTVWPRWLLLVALPLVGCAFQDWKDDEGRPRVDPGFQDLGNEDPGRWDDGTVEVLADAWDADGTVDTAPDATLDLVPEAAQDVAPEATQDLVPDAAEDVPPDTVRDLPPEVPQDVLPEAVQDLPPEASQDLPADVGPPDAALDVPPDSTGSCATPPGPEFVNFEVFGFPTEGSPMPPWGQGVIQGDGVLKAIEQTRSGWRYLFELSDGQTPTVETNLPLEDSIPFAVGETVHFYARQDLPWWRDVVLVLWDSHKTPRFVFQDASRTGSPAAWFDCGGSWLCPTIRMLPDTCPPVASQCGKSQYPPIEMLAFGGLASSEVPPALRQGFDGPSESNPGIHYRVYEAYRLDPSSYTCADYPSEWIRASIRVDLPPAADCDTAKIGFPRDNPEKFEFYEICVPQGDAAAVDAVKAIDPTLTCGVVGHFAQCDKSGMAGCHGDLGFDAGTKRIDDATWARICRLSLLESVSGFGGGFFL